MGSECRTPNAYRGLTSHEVNVNEYTWVIVNGIAPGLMLRSSGQSEANFRAMYANNPLRRGVEPSDVVNAIRYLIDAKCMTGQVLVIDSGQRFLALERDVQFLGEE